VVVPFPFTEKRAVKHRQAVVLSSSRFNENHDHLTLAMITSAKNSSWYSDVTIQERKAAG
jgi:mRNA interferase MazF